MTLSSHGATCDPEAIMTGMPTNIGWTEIAIRLALAISGVDASALARLYAAAISSLA